MSDWVEGHVERVVWASDETGYAVLRLATPDGEVTAVGTLASIASGGEGAFVALEGRFEDHPVHGRQLRATGFLQGTPRTLDGIRLYLGSSGVPGVGPKLAGRIVDAFGLGTLAVLSDEPSRLTAVDGIGPARAQAISERWRADEAGRALEITLRGLGLSPRIVDRIRRRYGERAAGVVSREPYRLAEEIAGIGFRTADALALQQGLSRDEPARVRAAVVHVLEREGGEGHAYLTRDQLARAVGALDVPTDGLDTAIEAAAAAGRVVVEHGDDGLRVWNAALYTAEQAVAFELSLRSTPEELDVDGEVDAAARYEGVDLAPAQRDAVRAALRGGVVVVTGGPGTGKTTLVRVLVRAARERGESWLLASPTGRAARRLAEATGDDASTVHRLLEFRPGEGGFQRGLGNPLEADGVVVDEASMVDLPLMQALVEALPPPHERRCALVLVGDADQLPSVGPGQVLRDVVASGAVTVVRLERIFRQGAESGIVEAAAAVHAGRVPVSGEVSGHDDCFLLARPDADRARETLLSVVADRLAARGFDPMLDVQVLAPTRRGPLGTETLNRALQERLNPHGAPIKRKDREFRVGDRVLCTKNRYDVEVFNGDTGVVVGHEPTGLQVDFDGRRVSWSFDELGMLDLAYAMTVHKSQGSEYPAVVLALHDSHGVMLRRNLFYTALTRARRFLCVVGSPRAWGRAVSRAGGDTRNTALAERLAGGGDPVDALLDG